VRKLYIIGIGAGHPDHVTLQAIKAMNVVDVFFFPDKGEAKQDLLRIRQDLCERHIEDQSYRVIEIPDPVRDATISSYTTRVEQWHAQRVLLYEQAILTELCEGECGAFLVWGDPALYDSILRIIDRILDRGHVSFEYEVIPGITSVQALAAAHKIPLNGIGESILITTGRRLNEGQAENAETVAVMLDGNCAFKGFPEKASEIYWGAYLGMDLQILVSGRLAETANEIEAAREAARAQHGWIMDCYLLRRPPASRPREQKTTREGQR
jgi:precorrin-6A synthase